MSLFEFLSTPMGIELTHAVIVLILAISGYLNYKSHKQVEKVQKELAAHIDRNSTT